ncbi:MAG: Rrf2 family transcriptional regulator [Candidatus Tectomicrobia bacterium]|uniref:Rrf2 family transcriptional regulator n=1 Tax=Tectimicrobiota bacterium TaxID=2528274 RepID=A0A933LR32_UNCTE|nr:Rrf2 family transcriptional regulator [Candidatus Tectomicrobia bacterium]
MHISFKGDYALKAVLDLALHHNQGVVPIQDIAHRGDMPVKFLEQILLHLKKAGLVNSKRGVGGGYYLSKDPSEITVGSVLRVIEGGIAPIACVSKDHYQACEDEYVCSLKPVWERVREAISSVVDNTTFSDLVEISRELASKRVSPPMYFI